MTRPPADGVTTRRTLIAAAPALGVLPTAALALPSGYNWRIKREGRTVGTHRVVIGGDFAARAVTSEVEVVIRLAGFTVFRYAHVFTEQWDGTRLAAFRSRADRNGTVVAFTARADRDGLVLEGSGPRQSLPREAVPLSWWDPSLLTRPLFDAGTGRVLPAPLVHEGSQWRLPTPPSTTVRYDAAGNWIAYSTLGDDGSAITYEAA